MGIFVWREVMSKLFIVSFCIFICLILLSPESIMCEGLVSPSWWGNVLAMTRAILWMALLMLEIMSCGVVWFVDFR